MLSEVIMEFFVSIYCFGQPDMFSVFGHVYDITICGFRECHERACLISELQPQQPADTQLHPAWTRAILHQQQRCLDAEMCCYASVIAVMRETSVTHTHAHTNSVLRHLQVASTRQAGR